MGTGVSEVSRTLFARAQARIAGGVSSPARSFAAVGGDVPEMMVAGEGAYLVAADGRRYIDYLGAFGPLVLGHAHPEVVAAIREQAGRGTVLGTPTPLETELAEQIHEAIPSMELLRFVTTGTEAVMSAVRLARAYTGRPVLVKFDGGYHGHSDPVLVRAGSGASSAGSGGSAGIPQGTAADVVSVPYNEIEPLRRLLEAEGSRVAAVLMEPIAANMGLVPPLPGFVAEVAALTRRAGALLIFDEVVTGFRFTYGGAQSLLGVIPDLTCLGKAIGGGLAAGAYGGRRDIMSLVSPLGPMFQAGTLAGNPLSVAAGLATLRVLRRPGTYERLEILGQALEEGLREGARAAGVPVVIHRLGSGLTVFFGEGPIRTYEDVRRTDHRRFARFFWEMLSRGVYLAPSPYEVWFLSAAHTEREVELTVRAAREAFACLD